MFFKILEEFANEFKNINASAMLEKWEIYAPRLTNILKNGYNQKTFKTEWFSDIEDVLILLKLLPTKQIGRNVIASESTFKKSVGKLIEFLPVNRKYYFEYKKYHHDIYS